MLSYDVSILSNKDMQRIAFIISTDGISMRFSSVEIVDRASVRIQLSKQLNRAILMNEIRLTETKFSVPKVSVQIQMISNEICLLRIIDFKIR